MTQMFVKTLLGGALLWGTANQHRPTPVPKSSQLTGKVRRQEGGGGAPGAGEGGISTQVD